MENILNDVPFLHCLRRNLLNLSVLLFIKQILKTAFQVGQIRIHLSKHNPFLLLVNII